jgi:hypothetical protein
MNDTHSLDHRTELTRLEILQAYKQHLARQGDINLSPFAPDRVIRYDCNVEPYDVPDIHRGVRERVAGILRDIHGGKSTQVVILAGGPGMGKSHLINYFRSPKLADKLRYVFICNSNHWKVNEFEPCLLDWILEALVRPSPNEPHLLLAKIEELGFEALRRILSQPRQIKQFENLRGILGRVRMWVGSGQDLFQHRVETRDRSVFRDLHFPRFADRVCDLFLPKERGGNAFHRYVLRILLCYLFPEERERVLHWLRGKDVDFSGRTGVKERMDSHYKVIDAIKILISLFTSEVSRGLSREPKAEGRGRIFFFAFDQMEGRQELFDNEGDWPKFFGQLSELYNTLPNVFILFTMTIALRQRLYPQMEAQFQHRITRDENFQLLRVDDAEILALYQTRIDRWLGEGLADVREKLKAINMPFLPFDQAQVLEFSRAKPLRETLDVFDREFSAALDRQSVGPRIDYLVSRNTLREEEQNTKPFDYTANHLDRVKQFFDRAGARVAARYGLTYKETQWRTTDKKLPVLCMVFQDPLNNTRWVRIFLARLPHHFNQFVEGCVNLLYRLGTDRNFLWLVRPERIDSSVENQKVDQVFARTLLAPTHTTIQAILRLLERHTGYAPEDQAKADEVIAEEVKLTYLGEMLQHVHDALELQQGSVPGPEEGGTGPASPPTDREGTSESGQV